MRGGDRGLERNDSDGERHSPFAAFTRQTRGALSAAVLVLIALILFGVAAITVAAVVLVRSVPAIRAREAQNPDPKRVEREVYEKLYGKRSGTVSAPVPVELPPKADADSPRTHTPSDPRPADSPATPSAGLASMKARTFG